MELITFDGIFGHWRDESRQTSMHLSRTNTFPGQIYGILQQDKDNEVLFSGTLRFCDPSHRRLSSIDDFNNDADLQMPSVKLLRSGNVLHLRLEDRGKQRTFLMLKVGRFADLRPIAQQPR